jgi:hypothetical protein
MGPHVLVVAAPVLDLALSGPIEDAGGGLSILPAIRSPALVVTR